MILRIVSGYVREPTIVRVGAALLEGARERLWIAPGGRIRFHVGCRSTGGRWELATIGVWPDPGDAMDTGLEEDVAALGWDLDDIAHFEIDESLLRGGTGGEIVRVATGRFSRPGADVEMQELLRQRLPSVGPEMTEAYVGRRIEGRAVEVTFVSVWDREPAARPLEGSMWPDIALRYDTFAVRVFRPVQSALAESLR